MESVLGPLFLETPILGILSNPLVVLGSCKDLVQELPRFGESVLQALIAETPIQSIYTCIHTSILLNVCVHDVYICMYVYINEYIYIYPDM